MANRWRNGWRGLAVAGILAGGVGIWGQEAVVRVVEGFFASGSGVSAADSVTVEGRLGGSFETRPMSSGDITVHPGLPLKRVEVPPPALTGDFDRDGTVGFADFLVFAAAFGSRTGDEAFVADADLDQSGDVGFADFLQFAAVFGTTA